MSKKIYLLIGLCCAILSFKTVSTSAAVNPEINATVLPGVFYLTVYGNLQTGIDLQGLGYAGTGPQVGYWNATPWTDYLNFYDASPVAGFRIQFSLDSDFAYSGIYPQSDVAAENLKTYASWDDSLSQAMAPNLAMDSSISTATLITADSCGSASPSDFSFNSEFMTSDYAISFSTVPFDYFTSTLGCVGVGYLNLGRFQLELGDVEAGDYTSTMYIIMVDGN